MNYGRVYMEVDLRILKRNIRLLREQIDKKAQMMLVVKADGYGSGAAEVSKTAVANGAGWLGVAVCEEGCEIRKEGIEIPILILGYTPESNMAEAIRNNLTQTIYSYETAARLSAVAASQGRTADVHIKIDTGMARLGFDISEESIEEIKKISGLKNIRITGVYSHFATADSEDKTFARQQYAKFNDFLSRLKDKGIETGLTHISNSAAALDLGEFSCDMVRVGIVAYGLPPSPEVKFNPLLSPIMSLKAHVSHVKLLPAGESVSYGRTYFTKAPTAVATVPVGYADGYSRILSNRGKVLIRGAYADIIGTICMDQFMVDVTHIDGVKIDDEVVLIGRQGENMISAEEIAALENTINYEVICGIGKRVPRVYK